MKKELLRYSKDELIYSFITYIETDFFHTWIGISFWINQLDQFNDKGKYGFAYNRSELMNELMLLLKDGNNIYKVLCSDHICERVEMLASKERLKNKVQVIKIKGEEIKYKIGCAEVWTWLEQDQEGDWYFIDFKQRVQYLDNNSNLLFINKTMCNA